MLEYEEIDISEGIDVNKSENSKEYSLVTFGISLIKILIMDHILVIVAMVCQ